MNEKPQTLKPFGRLCMTIGQLPASYVESMSYYEQIIWLTKYLQEQVIPVVNYNSNIVNELQDYVEHYFDNLDVQEEINNKLDEMASSGELEEIISAYLNSTAIFGFDNVASMKEATNLINGSYAETLGYNSKNDGGSGLYKIRQITNDDVVDEATIIELADDNLIAELIIKDNINPEQFGCYGDNTHDDSTNLQKALTYIINKNYKLILSKTYLINTPIEITGLDICIDGIKSVINYSGYDSAVKITGCINSNITLGYINAPNGNGIELYTNSSENYLESGWSQYVNIKFVQISASSKCIYFNRNVANSGWINEIRIKDGRLESGDYGIYADAKNLNAINNISIYNVGFEGITTGIYLANRCYQWNFNNCRYAENFTTLIETVGDIRQCEFNGSVIFPVYKCNISSDTSNFIINAPIGDEGSRIFAYNGCFYEGAFRPQIKNLDLLNLNRTIYSDTINYVMPEETYTDYIIIGNNDTNLASIKLNKSFPDSQWGDSKFGITEFILFMNFTTARSFTIYDATNNVIFNQGHNYTKAYLKFKFITNNGWICEQMDIVPTI